MEAEIKNLIAGILKIEVSRVVDDLAVGDISEWDSLRQMMIIAGLEKEYSIKFHRDELIDIENVGDIVSLVKEKVSRG